MSVYKKTQINLETPVQVLHQMEASISASEMYNTGLKNIH